MDSFETMSLSEPRSARGRHAKGWGRLRRHARLLSALAFVALPAGATAAYQYGFASDQYVSTVKFIVRPQAPQTASPASLSEAMSGGNPMLALIEDSEVVVQYIGSLQMLSDLPHNVSLNRIYAAPRADPLARLGTDLPPERQLPYWKRMVQPSFDLSSGIITVKVRAFTPGDAALVARSVLQGAQALVDRMSQTARGNALAYAEATANKAQAKLVADAAALADYRNRYQVLFPELSAQQASTVSGNLLLSLAEDKASLAALRAQGQTGNSPQVMTLRSRINAEETQVKALAAQIAADDGGKIVPLASIVSGYDTLMETQTVDRQLYASDLLALQDARNVAAERGLYLESFVEPAVPAASTYPVRWLITAETAVAGFIAWLLAMLCASMLRDQFN